MAAPTAGRRRGCSTVESCWGGCTGSGTHYTGQDEWFRSGDCARKFSNDAVVDLRSGNAVAHLCSTGPFTDVSQVHDCTDLMRVAKPT
jgi:hypothetical protein